MREVLRQEKKYLMTLLDGQRLCARLSGFLLEDAHSGAQGYAVRSLYFDTLDDGDYQDKMEGLELRRKLRLRIYDPAAGFAMLEMKQKEGAYQKKRSLRLDREAAERLIRGDFRPLLDCGGSFAAECFGLMQARCYRPRAVVEYQRRAFIAKENQIRITLDSRITATEACWDLFSPRLVQYPVLDPYQRGAGGEVQRLPAQLHQNPGQRGQPLRDHPEQILSGQKRGAALSELSG